MNFMYIIILFFIMLFLCEIFAILLKITGLDREKARFQIISIITHTGFTTRESELIAQHPVRRKMISYLMLFSYVSQATFFSLLIAAISNNNIAHILTLTFLLMLIIFFILKFGKVFIKLEKHLDKFISKRWMKSINNRSIEQILHITDNYEVIEVIVTECNPLCNSQLKNIPISNINVLLIDKGDRIIPTPQGSDFVEEGDRIVVYGKIDSLEALCSSKE